MFQNGDKTSNLKCQHQQEARQLRILISILKNWVSISPFLLFWLFCSQWWSKVCCRTQRRRKASRGRAGGLVLGRAIVQLGHKLWKFPVEIIITKFLIVSHYVHYLFKKINCKNAWIMPSTWSAWSSSPSTTSAALSRSFPTEPVNVI